MYQQELHDALAAVQAAAAVLRPAFRDGYRGSFDEPAEIQIRGVLSDAFPLYGFFAEHARLAAHPRDDRNHLWVAGPHDGTRAATEGFRGAAISIALLRDGLPVLGVVYAYCAPDDEGDLFSWAEEQGPVHRNHRKAARVWPGEPGPSNTALVSHDADRKAREHAEVVAPMRYRAVPGIAYRLALVAAGEGDVAIALNPPASWNVAAGHALLRGAGGDLYHGDGNPVTYDRLGSIQGPVPSIYYGGSRQLIQPLLDRKWRRVFEPVHVSPASDSLSYLSPGCAVADSEILSRAQGCLLGQLAGDALGSLVEFQDPESIQEKYPGGPRRLEDGGAWDTIAGQPTDDSELALALARSIVQTGRYDEEQAARAYATWRNSAPFDIGNATSTALSAASMAVRLDHPVAAAAKAAALKDTQANGALMRISPLGIFGAALEPSETLRLARLDAALTHPHEICRSANGIFAAAMAFAIRTGAGAQSVWDYALRLAHSENAPPPLMDGLQRAKSRAPADFLESQGWVLIALQNAFYQLLHAARLEEGIVNTVRAGGDTDTNAAIAGALLGAVHGRASIPPPWADRILTCRPLQGLAGVHQPRPPAYWPVDALVLAERLLLAGMAAAERPSGGPSQRPSATK
jgi:ADP-ribosylglycohydrolase/fructose-1,6-bisphosphatase/inositol monophosphatase family enzyme